MGYAAGHRNIRRRVVDVQPHTSPPQIAHPDEPIPGARTCVRPRTRHLVNRTARMEPLKCEPLAMQRKHTIQKVSHCGIRSVHPLLSTRVSSLSKPACAVAKMMNVMAKSVGTAAKHSSDRRTARRIRVLLTAEGDGPTLARPSIQQQNSYVEAFVV